MMYVIFRTKLMSIFNNFSDFQCILLLEMMNNANIYYGIYLDIAANIVDIGKVGYPNYRVNCGYLGLIIGLIVGN